MIFKSIDDGKLPEAQSRYAAGYDVFANHDLEIRPGQIKLLKLGFALDISPEGLNNFKDYFFGIYLRGKKGAMLVNGAGIINIDSNEEVVLELFNPLDDPCSYENRTVKIKKGEAIAQIVLKKHYGHEILGKNYRK